VLAAVLAQIDSSGGWIPFDRYMELVLYAPGLGYYSAGSAKLGPGGDFSTAPEISSLFSHCVARQCAEILAALRYERRSSGSAGAAARDSAEVILEVGAGSGRMAADILPELDRLGALPSRYCILEISADLRERQEQRLARLARPLRERVVWLESLPDPGFVGVILANEVLDALPCKRFAMGSRLFEVGVEAGGGAPCEPLRLALRPAEGEFRKALAALLAELPEQPPVGYMSEFCPRAGAWVRSLASTLQRGAMLLFDYGLPRNQYYHPMRGTGTLRCHCKHRVHDEPLVFPGVQDITAWVDFSGVAGAAQAAGLEVAGFVTQAAFLLGTGIEAEVSAASGMDQLRLSGEARRLLLPGEMGEAFKAMALTRALDAPLAGFRLQDLRRSL